METAAARGHRRLTSAGVPYGYCLNAHPTEDLAALRSALRGPASDVRRRLGLDVPLGVELRLGAPGIRALAAPGEASRLADELEALGLVGFCANGFPLSVFTAGRVKEQVYRPDWTEPERAALTLQLAEAMAALAPPPTPITISTVAGMFVPRGAGDAVEQTIALALHGVARGLADLEQRSGRAVRLCLEPEPFTTLTTTAETVRFFERWLLTGDAAQRARARRYLGVNLDICHQAVVYESVSESLQALADAGIPVGKVHVSAALQLDRPSPETLARLAAFDEPRYLHQSYARRPDGRVDAFVDLGDFLAAPGELDAVRVHFHVPLSGALAAGLGTTRDEAIAALRWLLARPDCPQLVVETYTWDVLRDRDVGGLAGVALADGIASELRWLLETVADGSR